MIIGGGGDILDRKSDGGIDMSTFSPKTPDPGWEKRWISEALALMRGTPEVLLVTIALSAAGGYIKALAAPERMGLMVSSAVTVFLACFLFSPLLAWGFFALGRREGYVSGRFTGYNEAAEMSFRTGIFVLSCFGAAWLMTLIVPPPAEAADLRPLKPITASSILYLGADGLAQGFIFGWAGMFRHLTVGMVGASADENRFISKRAHEKLVSVFPRVTIYAMASFFAVMLLPGWLVMALYLTFFYWLYVSGREIIGGITGNKQASQSRAPVLGAA